MNAMIQFTGAVLLLAVMAGSAVAHGNDAGQKAARIIVREVDFEEASIDQIVEWIRHYSARVDPEGVGINVLVRRGDEDRGPSQTARVTLALSNVPLSEMIRYVCMAAGMNYRFEETAVIIADPSVPMAKMETRFYPVSGDLLRAATRQMDEDR